MPRKKKESPENKQEIIITLEDDIDYRNKPSADDIASGRGRPEYIPNSSDYDKVKCLAICKRSHKYIAQYIGITVPTLKKHYADLLAECKTTIIQELEQAAFYNATVKMNSDIQKFMLASHKPEVYSRDQQLRGGLEEVATEILKTIANALPD